MWHLYYYLPRWHVKAKTRMVSGFLEKLAGNKLGYSDILFGFLLAFGAGFAILQKCGTQDPLPAAAAKAYR